MHVWWWPGSPIHCRLLARAGPLYAYVPHTCAPLCLRTTYVPHTYHVLVSSTSALVFSTRCKDMCTCHPIETSAHAFSICTCCPLKTLRLVRFPNLPAPNLRERLLSTKDPKGAWNVCQSLLEYQTQMQEESCKMHKLWGGKGQEKRHRQKDQSWIIQGEEAPYSFLAYMDSWYFCFVSIFKRCLFPVCLTQDVGLVWHGQGCGGFHHKLTSGRHCILYSDLHRVVHSV